MLRMLVRRLFLGFVTVWIVSVIIFAGVEALPGDACTAFLERDAQGKLLENCRRDLGLDKPAVTRYLDWAGGAIRGDFGVSPDGQQSIASLVGDRVKNSFLLAAGALAVGVPLAIFLGVITGLWRDRWVDILFSTGAIFAMTIPEFVSATVLILIFAIWLGWVPAIVLTPADAPALDFFPRVHSRVGRADDGDDCPYHAHGPLLSDRGDGQRLRADGDAERRALLADCVSPRLAQCATARDQCRGAYGLPGFWAVSWWSKWYSTTRG